MKRISMLFTILMAASFGGWNAPVAQASCQFQHEMHMGSWQAGAMQTITGKIKDVVVETGCMRSGEHLLLRVTDGATETLVLLGPVAFVNSRTLSLAIGDSIKIKGYPIGQGQVSMIASEVELRGKVTKLRDENGKPVWSQRTRDGLSMLLRGP